MADEIVYKKMTRKADKGLEGKVVAKHGKQTNQKLKPYVVLEYLMKYSDENNTKSSYDIIGYLEGCGISAERRSIYPNFKDGRPKKYTPQRIRLALDLLEQGKTYRQITEMTGISKSTLIRARNQGA